jgi:hypothetical protein
MKNVEAALLGQNITSPNVLSSALQQLSKDVPTLPPTLDHQQYRLECASTLLYKFVQGGLGHSYPNTYYSLVTQTPTPSAIRCQS